MVTKDPVILVVDDNALIIDLIRFALRDITTRMSGATSAPRALSSAQETPFSLIITDLVMPGMSGSTFIKQLRQLPGYATTPIIVISGYDEKTGARDAHAAGAALFIPKPFTAHDIADAVRHVLRGHKDRPGERQAP